MLKWIVVERTVALHSGCTAKYPGKLETLLVPSFTPRVSNLISQEWEPVMGIFVTAPLIILRRAWAEYQWLKTKIRVSTTCAQAKSKLFV